MDDRTVVAAAIVLVVLTGAVAVDITHDRRMSLVGHPPAAADCRYDEATETLTFEVRRGEIDDASFAGVRVFVDEEPAALGGPNGTTATGHWVADEEPAAAAYPLERGSTVTVYGVDPDSEVYAVIVRQSGSADTLMAAATPARNCTAA